jgi:hypothetical protein
MLERSQQAEELHQLGLRQAQEGQFAAAQEAFAQARQALAFFKGETFARFVQSSRIARDIGFTHVRAAAAEGDHALLDLAWAGLRESVENTAAMVGGTMFLDTPSIPGKATRRVRREVYAEHGATLSLLGRFATVRAIMLGEDAEEASADRYEMAHAILRKGSNGYYRVSNAMVAARQERLSGSLPRTARWLGRAGIGLLWTAVRDPDTMGAAIRTAGSRLLHLRSQQAATESVLRKP